MPVILIKSMKRIIQPKKKLLKLSENTIYNKDEKNKDEKNKDKKNKDKKNKDKKNKDKKLINRKYCIILRGHIRDAFKNDRLYQFLSYLIKKMHLNIDIYIYTWLNIEAKPGQSWRNLKKIDKLISSDIISDYFKDINIKKIYITDENNNILVGDCNGKISGTSKKGWKNMWCGIDEINNTVKKTGINYYGVINTRLDFFGDYIFDTYYKNYGLSYFYNLISEYDNTKSISFWENKELMGIDNFYIGNINDICILSDGFHNNLDEIIKDFPKTNHQEFYVFRYVKKYIK
jgi:hypothetical protein